MGVKGLWELIDAAGKPIHPETLNNKVLAVDVSIWLNQFVKGYRDSSGRSLGHAHLLGLFQRLCKLLFYNIKPIFVFDGSPPELKRETLMKRRRAKTKLNTLSDAERAKVIDNYLRSKRVEKQLQRQTHVVQQTVQGGTQKLSNLLSSRTQGSQSQHEEKDLFELPPLAPKGDDDDEDDFDDVDDYNGDRSDALLIELSRDRSTDIHSIDLEDEQSAFHHLSSEQKYEVLLEMRERRKQSSWAKMKSMPKQPMDFSSYQLERLRKRRRMQETMDSVGQEVTEESMCASIMRNKLFVGDKKKKIRKVNSSNDFHIDSSDNNDDSDQRMANLIAIEEELEQEEMLQLSNGPSSSTLRDSNNGEEGSLSSSTRIPTTSTSIVPSTPSARRPLSTRATRPSSDSSGVVITIDASKSHTPPEEDIFADVFIFQPTATSLSSSSPLRSTSNDPISKRAMAITIDTKESDNREHDDIFADVFNPKSVATGAKNPTKASLDVISEATSKHQKTKDVLAHISNAARTLDVSKEESCSLKSTNEIPKSAMRTEMEGVKDIDDEQGGFMKETQNQNEDEDALKATMRDSNHLFFKMAARWADDATPQNTANSGTNEISDEAEKEFHEVYEEDGMLDTLTKESAAIIKEMHEQQRERRLTRFTATETPTISSTIPTAATSATVPPTSSSSSNVVYGSSAPGFVRGGSSVVCDVDPMERTITEKLGINENEENEQTSLSTEELLHIQDQLAEAQQSLVANMETRQRLASSVTEQMYVDCQHLLQLFGVPYVVAPGEAEAQCAFLDEHKLCHGIITDDADVWLFGGCRVFKSFFSQEKHCQSFTADEISLHFGLDRKRLIAMAMMTGSDYTEGIDHVGPVTAMEILAHFKHNEALESLRNFARWKKDEEALIGSTQRERFRKLNLPQGFPEERVYEAYLAPLVDRSEESFSWSVPNFVAIRDFALHTFGWNREKSDQMLKPLIRARLESSRKQDRIDNFFNRQRLQLPSNNKHTSSRVKAAVERVKNDNDGKEAKDTKNKGLRNKPISVNRRRNEKAKKNTITRVEGTDALTEESSKETRMAAAKSHAAKVLRESSKSTRGTKNKARGPKRVVLENHNLSESDSD